MPLLVLLCVVGKDHGQCKLSTPERCDLCSASSKGMIGKAEGDDREEMTSALGRAGHRPGLDGLDPRETLERNNLEKIII
jgi:hypothetical protein